MFPVDSADVPAPAAVTYHILGTAGHIDHGKTSLVRALTGVDTDRLPEERRRGMTIELGFAPLQLGDIHFGVVDVPGHERFVRTMVAGATGIDLALIVVAADDAVMPQTIEHVEILNLLGVSRGVVAVTKIDLVEDDLVKLVAEDVRTLLAGTALGNAPICPVSSTTGQGLDELKRAIHTVARAIQSPPPQPPFRMAIDRVFAVAGRGTVVTGSTLRGTVSAGDVLEFAPTGETCRVRGLQTHGVHHDAVSNRQRTAINVSGIDRERVLRGRELTSPGYLQPSPMMDVRLTYLRSSARPMKSSSVVRLNMGTMEAPVRVVLADRGPLPPGGTAYAQLRSGRPLTATYGQRFILRDETASRTIGGGLVLRPVARRRRGELDLELERLGRLEHGDDADRVEEVLRGAGFAALTDLHVCARSGVELADLPSVYERLRAERRWVRIEGTEVYATPDAYADLARRATAWLERHHRAHPDRPGRSVDALLGWLERMTQQSLARPILERLIKDRVVKLLGPFVCLPAFAPELSGADEKLLSAMLEALRAGGFQPPAIEEMPLPGNADGKRRDRLAVLAAALGEIVKIDAKLYLHREWERRLCEKVAALIAERGGVTVAEVREALDSSRKYVVPFLEYLDRIGVTRRIGDRRLLSNQAAAATRTGDAGNDA